MKKWLEEKILIKYWTENCSKYTLRDGRRIKSAQHSLPFDSYPDIQKNELDDGTIVPAIIYFPVVFIWRGFTKNWGDKNK